MSQLVCHLAEANLDVPFFRSIARLHAPGFPVIIGSMAPTGRLQEAMTTLGARTFSLEVTKRKQYAIALARLVLLLRRMRISVLHAHGFDATFVGLIAARLARSAFVFTRHHSDGHIRMGKRVHTLADRWCGQYADYVIAVSAATRRIMIESEGVPGERIAVVYSGVERPVEARPEELCKLRSELGLRRDERVCLVIGRLHEEKGHRSLFDALPEVLGRVGRVMTLLAGDGPHRSILEGEVEARGLRGVVQFLGYRNDVAMLISIASVVVLPSLAESFGQALTEAMSFGKPVVATAVGGIPEVVVDGETGLLVPPGDSSALAQAICRVFEEIGLARSLGEAGRLRASSFSYEDMLRGYEAVYGRLLNP